MSERVRAAQYVRMSTERQDYSIAYQIAANAAYALQHGFEIVRTYTDAGLSGLTIERRVGLKALLSDIVAGTADFREILVYDVSRWGRFQNPDQAAYYEFICAEAGVSVRYCAEVFENDGSPASALLKHLKRAMAAEYSRELSERVMRAHRGLRAQGFWMGGVPAYGFRRQVLDRHGRVLGVCGREAWKFKDGAHSRLVLGPSDEIETVRRIFRMYLRPRAQISTIAHRLNAEHVYNSFGRPWLANVIGELLQNEIYIGRMVSGRSTSKLGSSHRDPVPRESWVVVDDVVPPIVSKRTFGAVQRKREAARARITSDAVLADVRRMVQQNGTLTQRTLRRYGRFSSALYSHHLGNMDAIRRAVGVTLSIHAQRRADVLRDRNLGRGPHRQIYADDELLAGLRRLLEERGRLTEGLIDAAPDMPSARTYANRFGGLTGAYRRIGYPPA